MPFKQKGWVEAGVKQEIADNISHQPSLLRLPPFVYLVSFRHAH